MKKLGWRQRRRILGLSCVAVAAMVVATEWGEAGGERPRYLVARFPLEAGTRISPALFSPRSRGEPGPGAVAEAELGECEGRELRRTLRAGEVLQWADVGSGSHGWGRQVPPGKRAYSFRPENQLRVRARDRLDVVLSPRDPDRAPAVVVEGALVLGAPRESGEGEIVVAIGAEEVALLEKARQQGTLTVALRNPEDPGSVRRKRRKAAPGRVQIWTEVP